MLIPVLMEHLAEFGDRLFHTYQEREVACRTWVDRRSRRLGAREALERSCWYSVFGNFYANEKVDAEILEQEEFCTFMIDKLSVHVISSLDCAQVLTQGSSHRQNLSAVAAEKVDLFYAKHFSDKLCISEYFSALELEYWTFASQKTTAQSKDEKPNERDDFVPRNVVSRLFANSIV